LSEAAEFLARNSYGFLFIFVLAIQLGLPLPASPVLLGVGALAGQGRLSFATAVVASAVAAVTADSAWYEFGRRKGARVLSLICRISLEPDSCVRSTEGVYLRYGAPVLLVAKFIPGLSTVAPPMAGIFRLPQWRFLLYTSGAAALWSGAYLGLGYMFSNQLERAMQYVSNVGSGLAVIVVAALAGFIAVKWLERRKFLRSLVADRITPEELKARLDENEPVAIVDLRHALDSLADPRTLPNALRIEPEELAARLNEIPKEGEVVLYCT
jgi:membrane protein DedA with SNARE-associated domain